MKYILATILIASITLSIFSEENQNSTDEFIIKDIHIEGSELSEKSILRYIPVEVGNRLTLDELEKELKRGRIWVQYDPNYYFLDYEYHTEGSGVYITLNVIDATMPWRFDAFDSGPVVGYRNIFGEGITMNAWLGFSRQMLELYWKRIANGPIGFSLIAGHRLFNPFYSKYRSSAPGGSGKVFLWLTPQIALGATGNLYAHTGIPDGFDSNAKSITSTSVGGYLDMDYMALLDLVGVGFNFKTELFYYFNDLNKGTYRIKIRKRTIMRPFPTDRFAIHLGGDLTWSDNDLLDRADISLSGKTGRSAWQAGLFFPVNLIKFSSQASYYIGLEPGFWLGKAGTDNLVFTNPDFGISLAPTFKVGFPAAVFFAARFIYNLNDNELHFTLSFSSLPYTQELDMGY